ncbi:hypothetical protein BDV06DRAFT_194627 [Aspergillus oleicola]
MDLRQQSCSADSVCACCPICFASSWPCSHSLFLGVLLRGQGCFDYEGPFHSLVCAVRGTRQYAR